MTTFNYLYSLQFQTTSNFESNLSKLVSLIQQTEIDSIVLAPEVCLTGFYYEDMDRASKFMYKAIETIQPLSKQKIIAFTMIERGGDNFYNTLFVFHEEKIIYKQSKVKLFTIGGELDHFCSGKVDEITTFDVGGVKFGALICFELRFTELWGRLKGADVILVPAMWGKIRKTHFESLAQSLAISNQCYVVASDSSNVDMASSSALISPFGVVNLDDTKEIIELKLDMGEIKKMRRYIDVGIS